MFTQPESHSRVPSGPITPILNQVAICSLTSSNDIYSHHDLSNVILPQLNLPISPNPEDLDASKRSSAAPTLRGLDPVTTCLGNASPVVKRELRHKVDMAEPTDHIVSWDGHDDPKNPKKCVLRLIHAFQIVMNLPCSWSIRRKWMATVMVASRLSELKASWIFHGQVVEFEFLTLSVTYPPYSKPAHFQSSRVANPIRPLTSSITFTGGLYPEGPLLNG